MQRIESERFPIVSSGIDWLSIRTSDFQQSNAYSALAYEVFHRKKIVGEKVEHSVRVGFAGRNVSGLFIGHRESTTLLTLSSEVAREYGPVALKLGGSVARIDLQATIDLGASPRNLASDSYYQAKVMPLSGGRPRELKLTQTHPAGDTLNVNKRTSDLYGRIYDYGAAHSQGEKHRLWRYEIEAKRSTAKNISSSLTGCDDLGAVAESLVHHWFNSRVPLMPWKPERISATQNLAADPRRRDVLTWFETSLSITVGRAIKDYGLDRVLKALSLDKHLNLNSERSGPDARLARHSDEVCAQRADMESDDADDSMAQVEGNSGH